MKIITLNIKGQTVRLTEHEARDLFFILLAALLSAVRVDEEEGEQPEQP